MSPRRYILNDRGTPVIELDIQKWARWFGTSERQVALDTIDGVTISTVFLALDHNYRDSGPPILWETMVFGGPLTGLMDRCSGSKEQAEAMHAKMLAEVGAKLAVKAS